MRVEWNVSAYLIVVAAFTALLMSAACFQALLFGAGGLGIGVWGATFFVVGVLTPLLGLDLVEEEEDAEKRSS